MKKKTLLLTWLLMLGAASYAAQPGTSCANPIPLGKNFQENIVLSGTGTKVVWYTANTFDLPLSVYFVPQNGSSDPKPEVEMDFSCTPGVYDEDSIICSLFCRNSGSGIQLDMPHKPALKTGQTDEGDFCYYLAIGREYRDLLLKTGIDYPVTVYVKVTYKCSGVISIAPDDMFTNCMDGAKFIHLDDTVKVQAQDINRHVIVPYVQWQDDSIRYVWLGTQPCTMAVANACEFDPRDYFDANIIDRNEPGKDTLKVTSALMHEYVSSPDYPNEAGMYFVKCYSESAGVLKIERVPTAPPDGGATLLRYDKPSAVAADWSALYAMPQSWDTALVFRTPTDHVFRMYIGTTHTFTKETAIASYQFSPNDAGHWQGIEMADMQALLAQAQGQYLYVRFECSAKTTVTPSIWIPSECVKKANPIYAPSTTVNVQKGSYGAVYYRFYFREWRGGDMTFRWNNSSYNCPTFIGDNCSFAPNRNDAHVLDNKAIQKNTPWTIAAADLEEWGTHADEDGYLYIRFNPQAAGQMVISTNAPEEQDPEPVVYPAATIFVVCAGEPTAAGQRFTIRVSVPQTVNLYPGPMDNISSRTPIQTLEMEPGVDQQTNPLQPGFYTLMSPTDKIQIEVR